MTVPITVQALRKRAIDLRAARDLFMGVGDRKRAENLQKRYLVTCRLIEGRLLGVIDE